MNPSPRIASGFALLHLYLIQLLPPSFNHYSPNKSYNPSIPSNSSLLITNTTSTMANERITWIGLGNIGRVSSPSAPHCITTLAPTIN